VGGHSLGLAKGDILGFNSINYQRNSITSTATCVFDESLARRRKWWPKLHPSSTAGANNARIGL
jgi:hypothetical protein